MTALNYKHLKAMREMLDKETKPQAYFAIGTPLGKKQINVVGFACDIRDKLMDENGNEYYRVAFKGQALHLRVYLSHKL